MVPLLRRYDGDVWALGQVIHLWRSTTQPGGGLYSTGGWAGAAGGEDFPIPFPLLRSARNDKKMRSDLMELFLSAEFTCLGQERILH